MHLNKTLNKAIITSMTGKYAVYVFQLGSLMLLARLFTPEQFGVIAAAQVFIVFFQLLSSSGLAPAIVYKEHFSKQERNGVFTFTLLLGLLLLIIFLLIAEPLFNWFNFETGLKVFYVLAGCIFFSALSIMPMASLQKDTRFHTIATAEVFAELISLGVCLYLYSLDYTYTALAAKILAAAIFRFFFYYLFSKKTEIGRPNFGKDVASVAQLYGFAKYQLAFNFVNYFSRNLDQILIGKYLGAALLGSYEKVYQVMRYPLQLFTFAITPALQPVLTKHQDKPKLVENAFYGVLIKLSIVGLFAATVMFWGASEVIYILFGDQWNDAAPMLALLSISIPLQMVLSSTGGVFQAFGKTKEQFVCGLFSSATTVTAITIGIYSKDILLMCALIPLAFLINYFQGFYMLHKSIFAFNTRMPFVLVSLMICIPYLNYYFYSFNEYQLPSGYLAAFLQLLEIGSISSLIICLLYIFHKKILN